MARVLVFTDRHPADSDWKGAVTWSLIRSLAESQHEVRVLTTCDLDSIDIQHPRLTIARPAKNWRVDQLPKFLQGILLFNPDIVHTFALKPSRLWKGMSIWPYLHSALMVLPKVRRYSTFFDSADIHDQEPSLSWHRGSKTSIVFETRVRAALQSQLPNPVELSPLEVDWPTSPEIEGVADAPYILIPAPVSEWKNPQRDLLMLAKFLQDHPGLHAQVVGGWGDWPASSRRAAWSKMMPVADRLHLLEPLTLGELTLKMRRSLGVEVDMIPEDSWRLVVAGQLSRDLGLPGSRPALAQGSTANFLSRLFAGTLEAWPNP